MAASRLSDSDHRLAQHRVGAPKAEWPGVVSMMRPDRQIQDLESALQAYIDGRTGVRYEALVQFAEPLFRMYQLDLRSVGGKPSARRLDELTTLLAVLDAARLFWAYFRLPESIALDKLPDLTRTLLGVEYAPEDEAGLFDLLSILEEQWVYAGCTQDSESVVPGYSLPAFEDLLESFGARNEIDANEPDTLALFARPLFESVDVGDPEAVEDAVARAQAYWELAQLQGKEYERHLEAVILRFSGTHRGQKDVQREAEDMALRFRRLFS